MILFLSRSFYKLRFIFILCIIYSPLIFPQSPDTLWTRTYGGTNIDAGYAIEELNTGGYIICGYTRSYGTMSGRNVLLLRIDANGNQLWVNGYGGSNDEEGYSVKPTNEGGFIIAGYTKSYGSGGTDVFLIKTDSLGNELWNKPFGGGYDDEGYSVLQTNDGGYLIAGATSSFSAGGRDVYLIKTDALGNQVWTKSLGGLSSDGARCINKTDDGGFIITGWTYTYGGSILGNAWLVKVDSTGNIEWHNNFGGSDADRGFGAQQTSDGGYILTGYTGSFGAGLYDVLLVKTDRFGTQEWMKTFGGTGRDYGNMIQQTSDGGFIITGYTLSFGAGGDDLWIIKTDSLGSQQWNKTYGGTASDVGNFIRQTSDGGYIVTGHTLSYGAGMHDVYIIKSAAVVPVELISFTVNLIGSSVELKWTTASETNNKGFEVERKQSMINTSPPVGVGEWSIVGFMHGNGTTTEINHYAFKDENLSACKYIYRLKQIDFDGSFEYSNEIEVDVNVVNEFVLHQNYPNPFNPSTVIRYSIPVNGKGETGNVSLKIYDVLGNEVAVLVNEEKSPGGYSVEFDASKLSSGVYVYRLVSGSNIFSKKMIYLK